MSLARPLLVAAMLGTLGIAAAFRLPALAVRPMHADEANQAVKAGTLYVTGNYQYDAGDHHGPSLYWLTQATLALSGAKGLADSDEIAYRIVPVVFSLGSIALLFLFADGLGYAATAVAALLMAISPACVYFGRYYIQESLLVFFILAALGFAWRYFCSRKLIWLIFAGAAIGMMHATKETWVLSAAAAVGGFALVWGWDRMWRRRLAAPEDAGETLAPQGIVLRLFLVLAVAILVAGAFYSGFGRLGSGPWESITAYRNYWHRSQLHEHAEPWYYYLQILFAFRPSRHFFWTEGLIAALAIIGGISGFAERPGTISADRRFILPFLTFYTLLLTALYSLIGYKTPWCALSFLSSTILLAGAGAAAIVRIAPGRFAKFAACTAIALGIGHLAWQSYQLNYRFSADVRNPYVYAHTPPGIVELATRLDRFASKLPQGRDLSIHVVVPDNYWPLPWYLRKFNQERVRYWLDAKKWQKDTQRQPWPDVLIIALEVETETFSEHLADYNGQMLVALRPGVFVRVFVRSELWPAFIADSTFAAAQVIPCAG